MNFAQRDVGGLVFPQGQHLVAVGNPGSTGHHDPMLGTMVVFLQAEAGFGFDLNTFNLESTALVDAVVPTPWTMHFAVQRVLFAFCILQLGDDVFGPVDQGRAGQADEQNGGLVRYAPTDQVVDGVSNQFHDNYLVGAVNPALDLFRVTAPKHQRNWVRRAYSAPYAITIAAKQPASASVFCANTTASAAGKAVQSQHNGLVKPFWSVLPMPGRAGRTTRR